MAKPLYHNIIVIDYFNGFNLIPDNANAIRSTPK